jgi:hypothetical protein
MGRSQGGQAKEWDQVLIHVSLCRTSSTFRVGWGAEKNASRRGIELVFVAVDVVAWCPLPLLVMLS